MPTVGHIYVKGDVAADTVRRLSVSAVTPLPSSAGELSDPTLLELCQTITVLARAHQDAIWRRTTAHHQLRSLLREFYPTFLGVFTGRFTLGIASPEVRAVLAVAAASIRPRPRSKPKLPKPQLHQPVLVENAMGKHALALLAVLDTACANVDELGQASAELFQQHPD